ncbi:MAG: ferritin [Candidatus Altiarchaeales archaeon]|nr:ferritin [Candidatus Altiarchaeales archaeon]
MISKNMEKQLNEQINAEMYSSYLYLSMSAYFEEESLSGFASWMKTQAQEELLHAMKIYDFVLERGGRVTLEAIEKPPAKWSSPFEVFEQAFEHEKKVTNMIYGLVEAARDEKDWAADSMLKWFVDEQVEEEASAEEVVEKIRMTKDAPHALYMINKELGARPPKLNASG